MRSRLELITTLTNSLWRSVFLFLTRRNLLWNLSRGSTIIPKFCLPTSCSPHNWRRKKSLQPLVSFNSLSSAVLFIALPTAHTPAPSRPPPRPAAPPPHSNMPPPVPPHGHAPPPRPQPPVINRPEQPQRISPEPPEVILCGFLTIYTKNLIS